MVTDAGEMTIGGNIVNGFATLVAPDTLTETQYGPAGKLAGTVAVRDVASKALTVAKVTAPLSAARN